jgi:hypothetical protein
MKSPFPGMDPYLESPEIWPDFHSRFINAWCEAIAGRIPFPAGKSDCSFLAAD